MPLRGNPESPHRSTIPGAPWVVREGLRSGLLDHLDESIQLFRTQLLVVDGPEKQWHPGLIRIPAEIESPRSTQDQERGFLI
jgi:hypothetical protein